MFFWKLFFFYDGQIIYFIISAEITTRAQVGAIIMGIISAIVAAAAIGVEAWRLNTAAVHPDDRLDWNPENITRHLEPPCVWNESGREGSDAIDDRLLRSECSQRIGHVILVTWFCEAAAVPQNKLTQIWFEN
jgi:hypothetical protein